jgi:hypothetical protein
MCCGTTNRSAERCDHAHFRAVLSTNYLPKAIALGESVRRHEDGARLKILFIDHADDEGLPQLEGVDCLSTAFLGLRGGSRGRRREPQQDRLKPPRRTTSGARRRHGHDHNPTGSFSLVSADLMSFESRDEPAIWGTTQSHVRHRWFVKQAGWTGRVQR